MGIVSRLNDFFIQARSSKNYSLSSWEAHLQDEIIFWEKWLKTAEAARDKEYLRLRDPRSSLQNIFLMFLPEGLETKKILDVGAGPLTRVNKICNSAKIEICAVDALADTYDMLLRKYNITPTVRTQKCDGEKLSEKFQENSFDMVHSSNAIDHMYDPLRCIAEMIRVAKKGSHIILQFNEMTAEFNRKAGLHQWNLFVKRPRLFSREKHLYLQGMRQESLDVTNFYEQIAEQVYSVRDQRFTIVVFKKI